MQQPAAAGDSVHIAQMHVLLKGDSVEGLLSLYTWNIALGCLLWIARG